MQIINTSQETQQAFMDFSSTENTLSSLYEDVGTLRAAYEAAAFLDKLNEPSLMMKLLKHGGYIE